MVEKRCEGDDSADSIDGWGPEAAESSLRLSLRKSWGRDCKAMGTNRFAEKNLPSALKRFETTYSFAESE